MDNQITHNLKCNICNDVALGVFGGKWVCGRCLLKIESKIKEQKARFFEIVSSEIKSDLKDK